MALEEPRVVYARVDDVLPEETLKKALELARKIEELLEDTRSTAAVPASEHAAHSTRMARAMTASLVDELEALVRPSSALARSS